MVEAELWRTNWTPLHDPLEAPPGFGVRQSSGALAMEASQPKAPEDWRSPRRYRAIRSFMVPIHAENERRLSIRSEEHTSELQSRLHLVCRLLLEKKKKKNTKRV